MHRCGEETRVFKSYLKEMPVPMEQRVMGTVWNGVRNNKGRENEAGKAGRLQLSLAFL